MPSRAHGRPAGNTGKLAGHSHAEAHMLFNPANLPDLKYYHSVLPYRPAMPPVRAPPSYTQAAHRVKKNQFANAPGFISSSSSVGLWCDLISQQAKPAPPLPPRRSSDQVPCGTERCVHPCYMDGWKLPAALRQGRNNVLTRSGWRPWAAAGHRSCRPRPAADNTVRAVRRSFCECLVVES